MSDVPPIGRAIGMARHFLATPRGGAPGSVGRALIVFGLVLAAAGLLVSLAPKLPWLGRLPGDILIRRDHLTVYVPLASCLLASLVLSLICWILGRFR